MNKYSIIKGPCLTEKGDQLQESYGKAVIKVDRNANKLEIKQAIEQLFNVKVKAVNTLVRKGKRKVFRGIRGRQSDVKKAVVTLEDGHSIDVTTGL